VTPIELGMVFLPAATIAGGWPTALLTFVVGTCIGSFLNVCIHRLPADESIVAPASRCPGCGVSIAWYDNVPLLSWAWLGARCRGCRTRIPVRYPLVEAATGGLALLALLRFGLTPWALLVFAFSAALLLITFIDLDHLFIPDEVSLPGIAVGLGASFLTGGVGPVNALVGALVGGGILWAVAWGYERATGLEGMGFGDVKLLAMIGAFVGWQAIPAVLVIASLSGSLAGVAVMLAHGASAAGRRVIHRFGLRALLPFVRRRARRTAIPFGPFLALGAVLVLYVPGLTPLG
jgi:leader peptidase (prepilin peptidase)/N-methyltransferase